MLAVIRKKFKKLKKIILLSFYTKFNKIVKEITLCIFDKRLDAIRNPFLHIIMHIHWK